MCVDIFELTMKDLDIIHGMDFLQKCYAFMDYCSSVSRIRFPNYVELVWEG